jgi:hypothetical protein
VSAHQTEGECPRSERVDGPLHSWRFDGDDPYTVCVFCDEMRDTLSGRTIRPAAPAQPVEHAGADEGEH